MSEFSCLFCKAPIAIQAFIAGVSGFDRGTRSGFSTCRNCNKSIEFQVRNGNLTIGYSYSSGSLHFEGLFDVPASGLKCVVEEQGVHYFYKGIRYEVPGSKANR
jgi:hypothetical protein